ncbi:MAG: hypothetical protein LW806_01775 [Planctomycetaceae bacterium]|nr:hypothetical protein [Planctomycetaceae bacterium]
MKSLVAGARSRRVVVAAVLAFSSYFVLVDAASAAPPAADRGDLAAAYLRFERAVAAVPKDPATRRMVNEAFDALTGDFFAGRFDRALARLATIEGDLKGEPRDAITRLERAYLAGHRFVVTPRVARAADVKSVEVRAIALEGLPGGSPPTHIVLRQGSREIVVLADALRTTPADDAATPTLTIPIDPPLAAGTVDVFARMPDSGDRPIGRLHAFAEDPIALGAALGERIARVAERADVDPSTLASLKARHELAFGSFDRGKSADGLAQPIDLAAAVAEELDLVEAGKRPYARAGDRWRIVRVLGTELPIRQYIPEGEGIGGEGIEGEGPFPLVIAFHGAGGDENLFFDGYGGGRLLDLARERRIAVVCPPTIPFGVSPNVLPKFLEELAKDVPFDPARVGLVGHSLGAATASRLAVLRPESINGAVCIAGFADLARKVDVPPRIVFLAALDPLFPLASTRAAVEAARERGDAIEVVVVENEGHTLVVGEVIAQAVDWLLARAPRATATTPPTQSAPTTPAMNTGVPASRE